MQDTTAHGYLTEVSVGWPSAEVVGIGLVELGARLEARWRHGVRTGHGYVTGKESRLYKKRFKTFFS